MFGNNVHSPGIQNFGWKPEGKRELGIEFWMEI
jgi:hypothetical protein